jgi:phage portal protein BeeE
MPYFEDRNETLANIARSYNVSQSTISRLGSLI